MGFWFFGPITWRWGGGGGKRPGGSVTVFGAFVTLPSRRGIYGDGNTRHSSLTPSSTPSIEETPSGEANET